MFISFLLFFLHIGLILWFLHNKSSYIVLWSLDSIRLHSTLFYPQNQIHIGFSKLPSLAEIWLRLLTVHHIRVELQIAMHPVTSFDTNFCIAVTVAYINFLLKRKMCYLVCLYKIIFYCLKQAYANDIQKSFIIKNLKKYQNFIVWHSFYIFYQSNIPYI